MDFLCSIGNDLIQKKYLRICLSAEAACQVIHPSGAWEQQLLQCLCDVRDAFHTRAYAYELAIKIHLMKAVHLLVTHMIPQSDVMDTSDYRIVTVKSMMEYLRVNYERDISLKQLEGEFGLSKGHICRLFKAITHMTPIAYLNYYRINLSTDFLENSDDEIGVIAIKSGFNNISYYNRTFQKYMHMTPSAFRKSRVCTKQKKLEEYSN